MPSYRYTRDIKPEDLQPEQGPDLSSKEKRQNWWHYHWKFLAVGGVALALLIFFLVEIFTKPTPDLQVALLTSKSIPDQVVDLMSEGLAGLVGDLNGDGQAHVEIMVCQVNPYVEEDDEEPFVEVELEQELSDAVYDDPYTQMAGVTRLIATLDDKSTLLFIMETELLPTYQQSYGILGYLDGTPAREEATDYENMAYAWSDCAALAALDFTIEYDGGTFDAQEYMDFFSIGVRQVEDTKLADSEQAWAMQKLVLGLLDEWK